MPSGLSAGGFVSLASGRLQSSCQVGTEGGERILEFCLRNLNWILITIL